MGILGNLSLHTCQNVHCNVGVGVGLLLLGSFICWRWMRIRAVSCKVFGRCNLFVMSCKSKNYLYCIALNNCGEDYISKPKHNSSAGIVYLLTISLLCISENQFTKRKFQRNSNIEFSRFYYFFFFCICFGKI